MLHVWFPEGVGQLKNIKGALILLVAALIWGMAFVAQSSAADSIGPFTFNALRSFVGALFLLAFLAVRTASSKKAEPSPEPTTGKRLWLGGGLCGVALFVAVNFQQLGLTVYPDGIASSGRAGFITATYVVMVALCSCFFGKKLHPLVLISTVGCLAGMYFLCLSGGFSGIYLGDLFLLLCAVCFAAHIMIVDRFSSLDCIRLSCIQFLTCGVLSGVAMLLFEQPDLHAILAAWLPILYTGIFSSGVAYTLQMIGQKYAEPAVASIVMSLESVFSALAGWVLLHEVLSPRELLGCALVFAAVILAQVPEFLKKKQTAGE